MSSIVLYHSSSGSIYISGIPSNFPPCFQITPKQGGGKVAKMTKSPKSLYKLTLKFSACGGRAETRGGEVARNTTDTTYCEKVMHLANGSNIYPIYPSSTHFLIPSIFEVQKLQPDIIYIYIRIPILVMF